MLKEGKRPFDPQHHLHLPANEPSNSHGPMMYLLPKTSATFYAQRQILQPFTNSVIHRCG